MAKRNQSIAKAWANHAIELTDWGLNGLVAREDCYGGQRVNEEGVIGRRTLKGFKRQALYWHFRAEEDAAPSEIIGLHCTSPEETCPWVAIDIDRHGDEDLEDNLRFAQHVLDRACGVGLSVILTDSSGGGGGYHLWILVRPAIAMAEARRLVLWLVEDWERFNLNRRPDLFPGNDHLTGKRCGHWLRLPGRHYKRPAWTSVWSQEQGAWLQGDAAIQKILDLRGTPVAVHEIVPAGSGLPEHGRRPPPGKVRRALPKHQRERSRRGAARALALVRDAIRFVPNPDLPYDDWLRILMTLREFGAEGRDLARSWSEQSDKHDPEHLDRCWESFDFNDGRGGKRRRLVTVGALFLLAKQNGWPGQGFHRFHYPVDFRGRRGPIAIVHGRAAFEALEFHSLLAIGLPDQGPLGLPTLVRLLPRDASESGRKVVVIGSRTQGFDPEPVARDLSNLLTAEVGVNWIPEAFSGVPEWAAATRGR